MRIKKGLEGGQGRGLAWRLEALEGVLVGRGRELLVEKVVRYWDCKPQGTGGWAMDGKQKRKGMVDVAVRSGGFNCLEAHAAAGLLRLEDWRDLGLWRFWVVWGMCYTLCAMQVPKMWLNCRKETGS